MEVILRQAVENLGNPGEVVSVSNGYARNYLLPRGIAYQATEGQKLRVEVTHDLPVSVAAAQQYNWADDVQGRKDLLEILPPGVGRGKLPFGARIAGPGVGLVRAKPGLVPALHQAGHQVYVWTVNQPDVRDVVGKQQVDGVITDRPKFVLDQLANV